MARKKVLRVISNVGENLHGLRFSADGAKIVANAYEQIAMWDVASGRSESFRLVPWSTLTFAPDGSRVAAFGFFGALAIWNYASFGPRLAMEKGIIHWSDVGVIDTDVAAFSPDGHTLAGNGGMSTLHFWDAKTKRDRLAMPEAHAGSVNSILFSSDGKSVITSGRDATVRLWDFDSKRQRRVLPLRGWPRSIALSSDERWLLAISEIREAVYLWDLQNEKAAPIISTEVTSGWTIAACFSKPDNRVQVYWSDGRLRGLNLETGRSTVGKDVSALEAYWSDRNRPLNAEPSSQGGAACARTALHMEFESLTSRRASCSIQCQMPTISRFPMTSDYSPVRGQLETKRRCDWTEGVPATHRAARSNCWTARPARSGFTSTFPTHRSGHWRSRGTTRPSPGRPAGQRARSICTTWQGARKRERSTRHRFELAH